METLLVIATNRFFRESLVRLFRNDRGFRVLGAPDPSPLLGEPETRLNPELVVLRPEWDDKSFYSTRSIHDVAPQTRILMIGMEDDIETFLKAVRSGAQGYLLKDASAKQIVAAAHRLARNAVVCPQRLELALFNRIADDLSLNSSSSQSGYELTPREHQLTSLVASGLANKEIAGRLNLSVQTVKNHVHSILQKTQLKNRAMLAQLVQSMPPAANSVPRLASRVSASS
jgi:two-component system, NarL family, nitrate/nitrite response regulator NarL